jgi:cytochrome b6-f complex iron-sulfur subunit
MTGRALRRYVEDLLHGRRPRGFAAAEDDVATLRTAITLRAARPGDDAPRTEFVDALQHQLAGELTDPPPVRTAAWGLGRRGLLAGGAAVAAASAAVGVSSIGRCSRAAAQPARSPTR